MFIIRKTPWELPTRNTLEKKKKMVGISSSAQQCFSWQAVTAGDREEFTNKHYVEKPKCRLKNIGFNPIYGQSSSWNILYIIILDGRRGKKESSVGNLRARPSKNATQWSLSSGRRSPLLRRTTVHIISVSLSRASHATQSSPSDL